MLRYKRFCDSNAHVTTYETVASPNGRSSEWSLFTRRYHHTQKSTSRVNKQKMLAYRTAILLLISYFYGHSTPEQHGKYKIRPDMLALQSQEILNRPVFVLDILKSVWKFWKDSEQILNITENSEPILNIAENSEHYWKFWTDSEHYLSSFKSIYFTSFSLDFN
jgi:hypothetical protein